MSLLGLVIETEAQAMHLGHIVDRGFFPGSIELRCDCGSRCLVDAAGVCVDVNLLDEPCVHERARSLASL